MRKMIMWAMLMVTSIAANAQEELIKYGDFEQWITRTVKESRLVGGATRTLQEVGPTQTWPQNKAYVNQGGSPWSTSNVFARVCGVVKSNVSVYSDSHGAGKCVKLTTQEVTCKAIGIVNITVIAAGSVFLGEMVEPITSSSNPTSKMSSGISFTRKPKALKFDYKIHLSDQTDRIRETGFSKRKVIPGKDLCEVLLLLQHRWEDADGQIHAKRVGTMWERFSKNTDWKSGATFNIHYGDITGTSYYKKYMELQNDHSERVYYAKNSKGKMVKVIEEDWGDANDQPTHMVLFFNSSHGGPYIGSVGNTFWLDNVKLVY
ncbi:MAG: PCMD domain-containing protein [Bacteroidaceae bacterium]|nr:PCMD domain-containing protein [Bacteroidaceae bacterium]